MRGWGEVVAADFAVLGVPVFSSSGDEGEHDGRAQGDEADGAARDQGEECAREAVTALFSADEDIERDDGGGFDEGAEEEAGCESCEACVAWAFSHETCDEDPGGDPDGKETAERAGTEGKLGGGVNVQAAGVDDGDDGGGGHQSDAEGDDGDSEFERSSARGAKSWTADGKKHDGLRDGDDDDKARDPLERVGIDKEIVILGEVNVSPVVPASGVDAAGEKADRGNEEEQDKRLSEPIHRGDAPAGQDQEFIESRDDGRGQLPLGMRGVGGSDSLTRMRHDQSFARVE